MKTLEKALDAINTMSRSSRVSGIDPRIRLIVTLLYIGVVLSVPMLDPARLIWMFIFPILTAEISGVGYGRVFIRSLYVLPLIVLIGIFNPVMDRETFWIIDGVSISRGWVSFISIVLRGLLSLQALLVLIMSQGFYDVIRALDRLGCPSILTTQLMMVYRYMGVLLQEALTMHRARAARGFGRKSYPLKQWGTFVGQLLVRSIHRSRRIDDAMVSRGFTGTFHWGKSQGAPSVASWIWLFAWGCVFTALRLVDFTQIFNDIITRHV